jgi:dienelactone hydrolase
VQCEGRTLTTLIFVLNGNGFASARPNQLTFNAAHILQRAGDRAIQLSNPTMNTAAAFNAMGRKIVTLAHGDAIGLVGFSAGGALALRLGATPGLKVSAVLDYYGVPDVRAYLRRHAVDRFYRPISGLAPFRAHVVSELSGPITTSGAIVAVFGLLDPHVPANLSSSDLLRDAPDTHIYTYPGGHGASITASRPALEDFLAHV